jgi:hypothetical protein
MGFWLMPMWLSSDLGKHWSCKPPPSSLEIDNPRSLSDVYTHTKATYIFAFIAYAHLLSLTSKSDRYYLEFIELVAYLLLPVLPVIQFTHNLADILVHALSGRPWGSEYLLSALCGQIIYDMPPNNFPFRGRILDVEVQKLEASAREEVDLRWTLRLIGIGANFFMLLCTVIPYFQRLGIRFEAADYVATTGWDHRSGWVAFTALFSSPRGIPDPVQKHQMDLIPSLQPAVSHVIMGNNTRAQSCCSSGSPRDPHHDNGTYHASCSLRSTFYAVHALPTACRLAFPHLGLYILETAFPATQ